MVGLAVSGRWIEWPTDGRVDNHAGAGRVFRLHDDVSAANSQHINRCRFNELCDVTSTPLPRRCALAQVAAYSVLRSTQPPTLSGTGNEW